MTDTVKNTSTGNHDASRVEEIARRLVHWRSETGTPGEAEFADHFRALLDEIPYFQQNPQDVRLVNSHGDPLTRSVVAVVRGTGRNTLAMAGHFDTVAVDNYHDLSELACECEELKHALVADLSSGRALSEQEERALADLLSGDFIPGRGMLDMKSGVAAGVALLERFAAKADRIGNLMLIITPDEERESRGMRSLRNALPALAQEWGLDIAAALNMDVTSDQGDGAEGRSVYAGTIGKLLPFALVIGCSSHASYPFEGVSAQIMAASILMRFEGNAALADRDDVDISPPPICLEARDLRDGYEVTTPERFWLAFNWLYHAMTPAELFARFQSEVLEGAEQAIARFAGQAQAFSELTGKSAGALAPQPRLISFAELKQAAGLLVGAEFEALYAAKELSLSAIDNPLSVSRQLTDWLVDMAKLSGPAIVTGFAGLNYPSSRLQSDVSGDVALQQAIDAALAETTHLPSYTVQWKPHFQGISDMSFLGQAAVNSDVVSCNTPVSRLIDIPPHNALRFPVVNIGPWGREFHQRLERVHAPYAFDVLPKIIMSIVENFFAASTESKK